MRSRAIVTLVAGMVILAAAAGCDNVERLAGLSTDSTNGALDGVATDERQVAEVLQKAGADGTLDDALAIAMQNDTTVAVEVVSAAKDLGGEVADGRSTAEVTQMTPAQLVNEWFKKQPAPARKRPARLAARSRSVPVEQSSAAAPDPTYSMPVDVHVETKLEKNTSDANATDGARPASEPTPAPPGESAGTHSGTEPPSQPSSGPAINAIPGSSTDNTSRSEPRRIGAELSDSMGPRRGS